jgi:hypothetical protein
MGEKAIGEIKGEIRERMAWLRQNLYSTVTSQGLIAAPKKPV